jgi:hypothetical protein
VPLRTEWLLVRPGKPRRLLFSDRFVMPESTGQDGFVGCAWVYGSGLSVATRGSDTVHLRVFEGRLVMRALTRCRKSAFATLACAVSVAGCGHQRHVAASSCA